MWQTLSLAMVLGLAATAFAGAGDAGSFKPRVRFTTNKGVIVVELEAQKAPKTVENFLRYVHEGFYSGTVFHRVVRGFVVQGGGFTADLEKKPTHGPIPNEASNGLSNLRGTIAMARTMDPNSATAQFYFNLQDNTALDYQDASARGAGYCVFGRVVEGADVVDAIGAVRTHTVTVDVGGGRSARMGDVPVEPVIIEKAEVLGKAAPSS